MDVAGGGKRLCACVCVYCFQSSIAISGEVSEGRVGWSSRRGQPSEETKVECKRLSSENAQQAQAEKDESASQQRAGSRWNLYHLVFWSKIKPRK